jgi:hypothetical protein
MIIDFIMLEKGIFLETFLSIEIKLRHGRFSTNLRRLIHSARLSSFRRAGVFKLMCLLQSRLVLIFGCHTCSWPRTHDRATIPCGCLD